jgi:cytochrome b involved in lipid metabolism
MRSGLTFAQAHPGPPAILIDEFNTDAFKGYSNCLNGIVGHMAPHLFEIDNRRES